MRVLFDYMTTNMYYVYIIYIYIYTNKSNLIYFFTTEPKIHYK